MTDYIAVAHATSPRVSAYPWSGSGFGTKITNPATLPPNHGNGVAFTAAGDYIAVAHIATPYVSAYPWSGAFGTKATDPGTTATGDAYSVAFTPAGDAIAVAHDTSPRISVWPWTGGAFGTKVTNPGTLPTGNGRGVAFTTAGDYIAVGHDVAPIISVYPWAAGAFGTKVTNPAVLATGVGRSIAFTTADDYIALAHDDSPRISVWPWSGAFGTKVSNPGTLPTGTGIGTTFSTAGDYIAVAHATTPFVSVYPWSGAFGTKATNPGTLPASTGRSVDFTAAGDFIAVAHSTTPFVSVYPWSGGAFGTKVSDPATPPASTGNGVAFFNVVTLPDINITLTPVVVEAALVTPGVSYVIPITLSPVVVEAVLVTPGVDLSSPIAITLSPVVVEAALVTPVVDISIKITLSPVVVTAEIVTPTVTQASDTGGGVTVAEFRNPSGTLIAGVEAILAWETHRYLNRVGAYSLQIPVASTIINGETLDSMIERGWQVSFAQENTHPLDRLDLEYLMYRGVVEDKRYKLDESGVPVCELSGSFRGIALASLSTPTIVDYTDSTLGAAATAIVDGEAGGISLPADSTRTVSLSFNADGEGHQVVPRFQRLLRVGEYARWALRETWEEDALEFISIDAPPDSGYYLVNMEAAAGGRAPGIALIGGTPEMRRDGHGIVNRIIPFGSDKTLRVDEQAETIMSLAETRMGTSDGAGGFVQLTPSDPPYVQIDVQPTAGKTITISGRTYTFTAGATAAANTIGIGADVDEARANIVDAVNGADGFNTAHQYVEMFQFGDSGLPANRARLIILDTTGLGSNAPSFSGNYTDDAGNTAAAGNLSIAFEEVDVPLTLASATLSSPFVVQSGTNADGSSYYYLEDTASQARHGIIEMPLHRTDIKNPNVDNATTREAAANVLYQVTALELQRHRAPKLFVDVPVANGDAVWALPGDRIRLQYVGQVLVDGSVYLWEDIDREFLVIERHDRGTPSGVRDVSFTLAVPDVADVDVPEFPKDEAFTVTEDSPISDVLSSLGVPSSTGLPHHGGPLEPPCCDDSTSITDLEPPDDGEEEPALQWDVIFTSASEPAWVPTSSSVVIIFAAGLNTAPTLVSSGVTVTELDAFPDLDDLSALSAPHYWAYKTWMLEYDGAGGSWEISGPSDRKVWVARLFANQTIPNGVTVTADEDSDPQSYGSSPFSDTLSVSVSVTSADNKDAILMFVDSGSTALLGGFDYEMEFNGLTTFGGKVQPSESVQHNIGVTTMPGTLEWTFDGAVSSAFLPVYEFVAALALRVRLNDP